MRRLALGSLVFGLFLGGCFPDVEAACLDRCEAEVERECNGRNSSTDCSSICSSVVAVSDDLRQRTLDAGCTIEYSSYETCVVDQPACSTDTVAACAGQQGIVERCVEDYCIDKGTC